MEWNGGLKNGMERFFKVELATMCLGVLSYCKGCMNKSSACCQHSTLSGIMISRSELAFPKTSYSLVKPDPCFHS